MNLGEVGPGCPRCGRAEHEGDCLPARRPDYIFSDDPEPRLELEPWVKAVLWTLGVLALIAGLATLARLSEKEKAVWRAEDMRRTQLCEAMGGIPRYSIRGRSYDGCDFPKDR